MKQVKKKYRGMPQQGELKGRYTSFGLVVPCLCSEQGCGIDIQLGGSL